MDKILTLIEKVNKLLERANEQGLTKEQKHIDSEDSSEKGYWHYGYAVALLDVYRNFKLIDIKDGQFGTVAIQKTEKEIIKIIKDVLSHQQLLVHNRLEINKTPLLSLIKELMSKDKALEMALKELLENDSRYM